MSLPLQPWLPHNAGSMLAGLIRVHVAFSPDTRMVYIPLIEECAQIRTSTGLHERA